MRERELAEKHLAKQVLGRWGEKNSVLKACHIGSKWSSRSSDSSPSWSSPTPRYAAGAFRGLERQTKSQPSYKQRTLHQNQTVCNPKQSSFCDFSFVKALHPPMCYLGQDPKTCLYKRSTHIQKSSLVLKALG